MSHPLVGFVLSLLLGGASGLAIGVVVGEGLAYWTVYRRLTAPQLGVVLLVLLANLAFQAAVPTRFVPSLLALLEIAEP